MTIEQCGYVLVTGRRCLKKAGHDSPHCADADSEESAPTGLNPAAEPGERMRSRGDWLDRAEQATGGAYSGTAVRMLIEWGREVEVELRKLGEHVYAPGLMVDPDMEECDAEKWKSLDEAALSRGFPSPNAAPPPFPEVKSGAQHEREEVLKYLTAVRHQLPSGSTARQLMKQIVKDIDKGHHHVK